MFRKSVGPLIIAAAFLAAAGMPTGVTRAEETAEQEAAKKQEPRRQLFTGNVVLLQEALKRRDIKVADEMKHQAVLETETGDLIPIAADWRGRAFFQDKKLRDRPVEIVGYRQPGVPYLQALIVYFPNKEGQREEFDYWCDICAIPMYEIKECECCQGPIRHRYRPASLPDYLLKQDDVTEKASNGNGRAEDLPREKKPTP